MSKLLEYFKNQILAPLLIGVVVVGGVFVITLINQPKKDYALEIYRDNTELMYEGARASLVESIDSVIHSVAPSTCLNGLAILRGCEKHNIDLFFVLAQGQLESMYGTRGMAQKTNSVFNVYAYDYHEYKQINRKGKYTHPDLSIEPYLSLLKNRYLVGKTEQDLMVNYVDVDNNRYASNKDYEVGLLTIYNRLISCEDLINIYKEYNKYKILSGR